mmetsp:Transcript_15981/g.24563  ORF Transcript_15981/g.24563 Transcript_15981/m.24563 type:complete len:448 (-) Transcript_15981:112-1455(-)|eukprot:CAMPEP_0202690994 /NCGR_PEP_ID=MMETSP1385-20130828/5835_1 /ASSEMBLY_ACC=CAM_ASM_000861 /TAXON_ID=933848 /ORGANISM="Elphidium margaritaceum" /LENGTH=447 /DNA_ID=CAMNT_0049346335 /DNA_START=73 /DNA_END=1416 /DNA_ORIENTATION=-
MLQVLLLSVGIFMEIANAVCGPTCIHRRKPAGPYCVKWKLASSVMDDKCVFNCGEPMKAPNTGIEIVEGTLKGRVAPKTVFARETGDAVSFPDMTHMALDGEAVDTFVDKANVADKEALVRLDNCGAEYRFIAEIKLKGDANPFPHFKSTPDNTKVTTLDEKRDYDTESLMRSRRLPHGRNDHAAKTTDTELKQYPYNAVGLLWVVDTSCTMTLIGPKHGVTAAHCVFAIHTKNWRDIASLKFFPGSSNHWGYREDTSSRHLAASPCGTRQNLCYQVRSVTIPMKFVQALGRGHTGEYNDWAIVELERETNHGHLAFGEYTPPSATVAASWAAQSAGYPRGGVPFWQYKIPFPIYKKTGNAVIDSVTKHKVIGNPTDKYYPGQSGSSIWRADDKVIEAIFFGLLTTDDIDKNEADAGKIFEAAGIVDKKKYRIWCGLLGNSGQPLCT